MRHIFQSIGMIVLFFIMLLFPKDVFEGASSGLLLWFQIILPTLFPFLLISNLLLSTGSMDILANVLGKPFSYIFGVSKSSCFSIVTGFLCGYPMGAKTAADLVRKNYISKNEGEYLLSFCNNGSPVFIINFIVWKTLKRNDLILPTMTILMISPVIISFLTRRFYKFDKRPGKKKNYAVKWDFGEIDEAIMNGFEIMVKVGGYIMLFSVLLILCGKIENTSAFYSVLLSSLEMTNGLHMLGSKELAFEIKYPAVLALASFGGWCSIAQTKCVVQNSGFRIGRYIIEKLAVAFTASLLGIIYVQLL